MNSLFQINRELRDIRDSAISDNEWRIKKIMVSYGYSREDAEKILAYQDVEDVKTGFGVACGAFAAYKFGPIQKDLAKRHVLFRKFWMRFPLQAAVFSAAYLTSVQIPNRMSKIFGSRGVTQEMAMSTTDLVGRFRIFENESTGPSTEQNLINYLHEYSDRPFVKDELLARLDEMQKKGRRMRIRRMGKDLDDIYWSIGKIYGLENIAYVDDKELLTHGRDPIKLQMLVNKVNGV